MQNYRIFLLTFVFMNSFVYGGRHKHRRDRNGGKVEGRIVGGEQASLAAYPYVAQFFNMGGMCGGVILNSWTIMTAAHCLAHNTDKEHMRVQAGSKYLYDFESAKYKVKSFVIHEDFNKEQAFSCDLALLFLAEPLKLGTMVKKGILVNHDKWMDDQEHNFIVTGWGWTQYGGETSKHGLMKTNLRYVSNEECRRLHDNYKLTPDMFCLYGDAVRDTCKGDSGGGVLWNNMIVGLTSHGNGCANKNKPSLYTNLWILRDWIKENVNLFVMNYCRELLMSRRHSQNYVNMTDSDSGFRTDDMDCKLTDSKNASSQNNSASVENDEIGERKKCTL
ncbi:hypodermin-B-like [Anticarsia gemmatalis]|uniref:hypodermin-B-like n=1 Tax=Anticarsia gemmatalis TaxID=129554 RepID=UPI003F7710E5